MNIFETALRREFRFNSAQGRLTTEQLFKLPLTSNTGKANLNDIAVGIADDLDKTGARSFVTTASTDPKRTELSIQLEVVKAIIATREAENADAANRRAVLQRRETLLNARADAEARELGAKSLAEIDAELAALPV